MVLIKHWAQIVISLFILINFNSLKKENKKLNALEGTFCVEYILKDYSRCLTFKESSFTYEEKGHIGNTSKSFGEFSIKNNLLILNYNKSKPAKNSYYKTSYWKNNKDSVIVKVNVLDFDGNPIEGANILNYEKKIGFVVDAKGCGIIKFPKSKLLKKETEFRISFLGYQDLYINLKSEYNYELTTYLAKFNESDPPIINQIDTLKLKEITEFFFTVIELDGTETKWIKSN